MVLLCVCCMLVVTRYIASRSAEYFIRQQVKLGDLNGYIEEMINGQKVIKVFATSMRPRRALTRSTTPCARAPIRPTSTPTSLCPS